MIIDELFRPEVSPTNPEIQQFMRSLHFSLLLQRVPLEAMLHAAGLSVFAWLVLSERYPCIPGRMRSATASCMRIASTVPTRGISEGCSSKSFIIEGGSTMSCSC